jgi:uncharacterized protein
MSETRQLALITGASAGIGAVFARALAARGYNLVLVARRRQRLEELAHERHAATGVEAEVLAADLSSDAGMLEVERRLSAGDVTLLVNNAGFGTGAGRFADCDLDSQDRMHRLHVLATVRLTHAALRCMAPRDAGGVINVSSVAGFVATPGSASYSATKAWMNTFTEGVYLEMKTRRSNVRIQALCPGFTHSEFHDAAGIDRRAIPKNWWMNAEDVVEASLAGLKGDKLFVIPGWRYKAIAVLLAVLPRSVRHWGVIGYARRFRRARQA